MLQLQPKLDQENSRGNFEKRKGNKNMYKEAEVYKGGSKKKITRGSKAPKRRILEILWTNGDQ